MPIVPSSVLESGDEASKGTSTVRTKVPSDRAVCHVGYWVVQLRPLVMIISCTLRPPHTMIVPKAICCEAIQAGLQLGTCAGQSCMEANKLHISTPSFSVP